jgi:hypothetical protein
LAQADKDVVLLKNELALLEEVVIELQLGGGEDTLTSWLAVSGIVAVALFYPLIWRPLAQGHRRKKLIALLVNQGDKNGETSQD